MVIASLVKSIRDTELKENMKQVVIIISILWSVLFAHAQDQKSMILKQDLACLFDSLSMIGILGKDCSRIDIHFYEARKTSDKDYKIKGISRTRLSIICPFEGKISIDSIASNPQIKSECTEIDGFIYGHYWFTEHGDKRYSGVFSGSFKQAYRIIGKQADKGWNEIPELKLNMSEYTGKWKSANGTTKVCSWADEVIPDTPKNFCEFNDAGEWLVSPQYRKKGWENLYNAYYNDSLATDEIQKARAIEEQKWWVDKTPPRNTGRAASQLHRY